MKDAAGPIAAATLVVEENGLPSGSSLPAVSECSYRLPLAEGGSFRVGRASINELILDDPCISRFHAVFTATAAGVMLTDLGSLAGTFVNGVRISEPTALHGGDRVSFGAAGVAVTLHSPESSLQSPRRLSLTPFTLLFVQSAERRVQEGSASVITSYGGRCETFPEIGGLAGFWRCGYADAAHVARNAAHAGVEIMHLQEPDLTAGANRRVVLISGRTLLAREKPDLPAFIDLQRLVKQSDRLARAVTADGADYLAAGGVHMLADDFELREIAGLPEGVHALEWTKTKDGAAAVIEQCRRLMQLPIVASILQRLSEELPERFQFHSPKHTYDVLHQVICFMVQDRRSLRELELGAIAAAYHDAGYLFTAEGHEELGAGMAQEEMRSRGGYSEEEVQTVCTMIRDTRLLEDGGRIQEAKNGLSGYLLDADLSNFGREDFFDRLRALCSEQNISLRLGMERTLRLMRLHEWCTASAAALRQGKKKENIELLQQQLGLDPWV